MSMIGLIVFAAALMLSTDGPPQGADALVLAAPRSDPSNPLFPILMKRRSSRRFEPAELSRQTLSELLWSACGVNDAASGKRTVSSAYDAREIDVYAATAKGVFLYDAPGHRLVYVLARDIRGDTGTQGFLKEAPVHLIYVADLEKMHAAKTCLSLEKAEFLAAADAGMVSQNVSLYCASAGLNTVVRDWIDSDLLRRKMKGLKRMQKIMLVQTVGYADNNKRSQISD